MKPDDVRDIAAESGQKETRGQPNGADSTIRRPDDGTGSVANDDRSLGDPLSALIGLDRVMPERQSLEGVEIGGVRILHEIGEGGMGRVYEGEQLKLKRTVAVKQVRSELATPGSVERFEFEAKVLARLQHPGIAQIYDAGVASVAGSQVPYFIMEYVSKAQPLTRYAEERKLSVADRLQRFRLVCDAVAHGHHKGVIHRDLKPGNIVVDAEGQPKVIDFGIAKATDSDAAQKSMQPDSWQPIGTLQYMAPEQIDGDPDAIDSRCDVYALGVVLYELLTGKLPYDVRGLDLVQAKRIIQGFVPPPLSAHDKTLRGDLTAMVAKCLEKDRTRRYSSASELGADVTRYLVGDPIQGPGIPRSIVGGLVRLARRQRVAAALAVGLVVAVAGVMVSFTWWHEAEKKTQKLADSITNGILSILESTPTIDDIKRRIVELETLGLAANRNSSWIIASLRGHLAHLTGDIAEARGWYEAALKSTQELVNENPHDAERRRYVAASHCRLGDLATATNDFDRAREHLNAAFQLTEALVARDPDNAAWKRNVAVCRAKLGELARAEGDRTRAREHLETTCSILHDLVEEHEGKVAWSRELAVSHRGLGDLAQKDRDFDRARGHFDKAREITRALVQSSPANHDCHKDLAVSLGRLGDLALTLQEHDRARGFYQEALGIMRKLIASEPRNAHWRRDLAVGHGKLSSLAEAVRDVDDARKHLAETIAIMEGLVQQDPLNAAWRKDLAVSLSRLGDLEIVVGESGPARAHFESALAITESFADQCSRDVEWQAGLAVSHSRLGDLAKTERDLELGRHHFEKAVEIMERLVAKDPRSTDWQDGLAGSYIRLGQVAHAREAWADARNRFTKAVEVTDRMLVQSNAADTKRVLTKTLQALAECHRRLGDTIAAEACEQRLDELKGVATQGS